MLRDVDLLKKLLSEGAAVDDGDEEGRTALHFAAGYGEHACVTVLLEHKASLNAVDNNKNTPLHYAAGYGQAESCKMLLDSGADKSALNADGKTALEVAQLNEQEDVVAVLSGTAQPKEVKAEA
ncbi:ANK_REP_REGION domain-containing protein [Haematococcus lacustris]|uniref:ANK_REP_REGION domain-containing protein n=1 Tax=Haematococcus lacustris TaxID=44745 RepID=A0A699ZKX8_HAELA|nr:ANK_REP_REGION domain-containing protein [Haematococcus lacustris]